MTETEQTENLHPFEKGLQLYEEKAAYEEVIPLFEQGILLSPKDSTGYTCLAWLHLLRNQGDDVEKGYQYAQKALKLEPTNFQAHYNLVLAMLMTGRSGVRKEFEKAGSKCATQEDRQEVLDNFKDALERKPDFEEVIKLLKWMEG